MPELDPVIHAQGRLRALVTLATLPPGDRLTFPRMQELLDMTAGNLLTHLRRLSEAGGPIEQRLLTPGRREAQPAFPSLSNSPTTLPSQSRR